MAEKADLFEASASAIGYVYQLRKALHLCVERYGRGIDWSVAIEAGDDIEEVSKDGTIYYQLKHRAPGVSLTDASTDLWKTLRIWAHAIANHQLDLDETDLVLMTTAELPSGSAASLLQPGAVCSRDASGALKALTAARTASTNRDLKKAFEAFDALTEKQRQRMVSRIQVLGRAPDVEAVGGLLLERAATAVGHTYASPFLSRLEGWFFQRTIRQLRARDVDAIGGNEFDQVFTDYRNQFRPENLPIDEDIAGLEPNVAMYRDHAFVRQLNLIDLGAPRVGRAVRDYMRAFTQRSRWSDENLLLPGEIGRFERRLVEEWGEIFDDMRDELGDEAAEAAKVAAARQIYRWAMTQARGRIRKECDEPFLTKGSFHMLADDREVGWHIDFVARLMSMLEPTEARTG
ncbi:ABC-three component system protein [Streptomyces sp. NPDC002773]|uniref:ABC-three component system protein n=1 Tax=Streptomyces sp. NPDC002773 TaxID=3154430 RepID=UPI00332173BE